MDAVSLVGWFTKNGKSSSSGTTPPLSDGLSETLDSPNVDRGSSISDNDSSPPRCLEDAGQQQQTPATQTRRRTPRVLTKYFPISLPGLSSSNGRAALKKKSAYGSQLKEYEEIPHWLRNNDFIRDGYLTNCSPRECLESVLQWHNETLNIWTHLMGFLLLLAVLCYDIVYRLPLIGASKEHTATCVLVTATYTFTLLISSIYHTFKCMHERAYYSLLKADVVGIGLSLSATIMSGTYYAFHSDVFWLRFYLAIEFFIVAAIYLATFHPVMGLPQYEHRRNVVIVVYVAFALIPTVHWALQDGLVSDPVRLLLPRVILQFVYASLAFMVFARRFPECLYPGCVDYIGASHQIWHVFVILAELYWHETGFIFLQCHLEQSCDREALRRPGFW